jgi:hypothetical protein
LHELHVLHDAVVQQAPSTQWPVSQSASAVHAPPFVRLLMPCSSSEYANPAMPVPDHPPINKAWVVLSDSTPISTSAPSATAAGPQLGRPAVPHSASHVDVPGSKSHVSASGVVPEPPVG